MALGIALDHYMLYAIIWADRFHNLIFAVINLVSANCCHQHWSWISKAVSVKTITTATASNWPWTNNCGFSSVYYYWCGKQPLSYDRQILKVQYKWAIQSSPGSFSWTRVWVGRLCLTSDVVSHLVNSAGVNHQPTVIGLPNPILDWRGLKF